MGASGLISPCRRTGESWAQPRESMKRRGRGPPHLSRDPYVLPVVPEEWTNPGLTRPQHPGGGHTLTRKLGGSRWGALLAPEPGLSMPRQGAGSQPTSVGRRAPSARADQKLRQQCPESGWPGAKAKRRVGTADSPAQREQRQSRVGALPQAQAGPSGPEELRAGPSPAHPPRETTGEMERGLDRPSQPTQARELQLSPTPCSECIVPI